LEVDCAIVFELIDSGVIGSYIEPLFFICLGASKMPVLEPFPLISLISTTYYVPVSQSAPMWGFSTGTYLCLCSSVKVFLVIKQFALKK
jgi:hypothetical protein